MADVVERLDGVRKRIGEIASGKRNIRMCIPVQPDDDDVFIADAADDGAAEIRRLRADLDECRRDFTALQHVIVGDTGASAILTAKAMRTDLDAAREALETIKREAADESRDGDPKRLEAQMEYLRATAANALARLNGETT